VKTVTELCKNAYAGPNRWFCFDYNGNRTPGKEKLVLGTCEICRKAESGGELPSFLRNDDEE
jgi:hypothetical protein